MLYVGRRAPMEQLQIEIHQPRCRRIGKQKHPHDGPAGEFRGRRYDSRG